MGAHASVAKLQAQGTTLKYRLWQAWLGLGLGLGLDIASGLGLGLAMKYRLWQACRLVPLSAHVLSAPLTSAHR